MEDLKILLKYLEKRVPQLWFLFIVYSLLASVVAKGVVTKQEMVFIGVSSLVFLVVYIVVKVVRKKMGGE